MNRLPRSVVGLLLTALIMPVSAFAQQVLLPPTSVLCERLAAPTTGTCTVTPGNNALVIKGTVLAVDAIFVGGEVLVDPTGLIRHVGCSATRSSELFALADAATSIQCQHGVVSPGSSIPTTISPSTKTPRCQRRTSGTTIAMTGALFLRLPRTILKPGSPGPSCDN